MKFLSDRLLKTFAWFVLKPHHPRREVYSNTICNAIDCRLLGGSHTTTLHAVTLHSTSLLVRTLHRSKPSIGSHFQDLKNQFCLLPRSMTNPTNQHNTFQRVLFSLTRFL
ncbi:hypothetical protein GmHk_05G012692 [Glycine max]|nr:hypothetical protein GmHk_05G012692 [Glycine max]